MEHRRPHRLARLGMSTITACTVALAGIGPAAVSGVAAAEQSEVIGLGFHDSQPADVDIDVNFIDDGLVPDFLIEFPPDHAYGLGFQGHLAISEVDWDATATTAVEYDDAYLRQGRELDVEDTLTPGPGSITFKGLFTGSFGVYKDPVDNVPPFAWEPYGAPTVVEKAWEKSVACEMRLTGDGSGSCAVNAVTLPLLYSLPVLPGIFHVSVESVVDLAINVSPAGVATVRDISVVGGDTLASDALSFDGPSPAVTDDSVAIGCDIPAGSDLEYGFTEATYDPATSLSSTQSLKVRTHDVTDSLTYSNSTVASGTKTSAVDFDLSSNGGSAVLGAVTANNVPPVADPGLAEWYGTQGVPLMFNGTGSESVCGLPTLRWDFSDGGVAYGAAPKHTFGGAGTYSGLLTATDATGLTDTATFSIEIDNAAPKANAGPDTTAAWGRTVQFNGSATDGSEDQGTLAYSWSFGDGSPSANGGATTTHSYANPGVYAAEFTATDQHGASDSDTREVTIRKRETTASVIGSDLTYATPGTLKASLVDEFGHPVSGRTIQFEVATNPVGSAQTDGNGVASLSFTPGGSFFAGNYEVKASFGGDTKYEGDGASGTVGIAKNVPTLTYTGATKGAPNKSVALSATLKDQNGKAMAGRTVTFTIGTQSASGVTNANGLAAASIQLTQKPGNYPLTAEYTPAGGDTFSYAGDTASTTFSLQKK